MNALLDAALAYAVRGWHVHPLRERSRQPQLPDWPRLATTDPEQIVAWWARKDSNVGVTTGPASGLAVLDVDPRHDGTASLRRLQEKVGNLPATLTALTGGGGLHLFYAHPGVKVPSRANALGADFPGIDTRGDGGYVVAAPSIHPDTGNGYGWLNNLPLAPWPAEQLSGLPCGAVERAPLAIRVVRDNRGTGGRGSLRGKRRLASLVALVEAAPEGERNHKLHYAACKAAEAVLEGTVDQTDAWHALVDAGHVCGLGADETARTIRSAFENSTHRLVVPSALFLQAAGR